ncbi:MAG: hypothetical protein K9G26_01420 [Emcibacter sp.]|nr:hypothetical protein [Emcibacter sp.]
MFESLSNNDIYILCSYLATGVVLIAVAVFSWRAKKHNEASLHKLEQQIQELSEK